MSSVLTVRQGGARPLRAAGYGPPMASRLVRCAPGLAARLGRAALTGRCPRAH